MDVFPLVLPRTPSTPEGIEITIVYANHDNNNITSLLKGNLINLKGSTVSCAVSTASSEQYYVEEQGIPIFFVELHL